MRVGLLAWLLAAVGSAAGCADRPSANGASEPPAGSQAAPEASESLADPRAVDTLPCRPPPAAASVRAPLDAVRALAGTYALRLVEDSSAQHPHTARATGTLWLWPTSAQDSSVRYGERAAAGDTAEYPLYGALDIDLSAVHLPADSVPHWPGGVRRAAVDPLTPFVLAKVWEPPPPWMRHLRLGILVGTLAERRPLIQATDGTGAGLWVTRSDSAGLRGTWSEYGIMRAGRGHFCAVRVRQ